MNRARIRRVAIGSGVVFAALLLLVVLLVAWLLFTTSGARWVAGAVTQRFAPQVKYGAIDGTIAGMLEVRDFRFEGGPEQARIRVERMSVDPTLSMLFSRSLRIERAMVRGLSLHLPSHPAPEEEPDDSLWIEPPLEVVVRDFLLEEARVFKVREQLVHVRQLGVAARWSRDALVIERLELLPGDIAGTLNASGRITPQGETVRAVLKARWEDVVIPESYAGRTLASGGWLDVDGTPQRYAAQGEFEFGPPGELANVDFAVNGTDRQASIERFEVTQRAGRLEVTGQVGFDPVVDWNLAASASDFDPGVFLAQWPGSIDLQFNTQGALQEKGPRGTLEIARLSGELRGRPLAGSGELEFAAPSRLSGDLRLSSGQSRVEVHGAAADEIDATIELAVASLSDWLPESRGSLNGRFRVRGEWPELAIRGTASGRSLALAGTGEGHKPEPLVSADRLRIVARVESPRDPGGTIGVEVNGIKVSGFEFSSVNIDASGSRKSHRVALEADGEKLAGSAQISGHLAESGWRGELAKLTLDAPDVARLELRAPARVVFEQGSIGIGEACFDSEDGSLCAALERGADGALQASYSFEQVPLALANALAPDALPGRLRGDLHGTGKVRRTAQGQWFGEARVDSPAAHLVLLDDEQGESALGQHTLLLYEDLELRAVLEGGRANARLQAALDRGGELNGRVSLDDLSAAAPALRGTVNASMPTLAPFAAFVPTVANLDGRVEARLVIGGTVAAPRLSGNLEAQQLQADLGQLGIELREGEVRGEAARDGGFRLTGQVKSGKGQVEFAGTMSARGAVDVRIEGENFLAADIPAAYVLVTPELALTGNPEGYLLEGEVTIPRADINLQKLPRDEAPGVSPDVVVVRNGREVEPESRESALPLTANINVILGEQINITGYGLEASVGGQLRVREAPGAPTSGSGQLSVSGQYQAYGQDLNIEEGRLLFAGTPIDNPRLSIIAMREIDADLSTGLRISGSAKRPVITVISDPEVGQADALSYLVTGRSLSDVGSASGSSQDALASATRSLESAAGGLVAKRIGSRLGLDEAGVEENEMIGGSALTIGEYLSPRLYLSYGVGLFEPGEVIALRYKLTDDIDVKIERGSMETRTGIEYRIER